MIDIHQLRHYVKAMSRACKSLAFSPVLAALLALALISPGAWAGSVTDANTGNPGQTLEINSLLAKGKTTLIDFYSPFCPPCVRLAPLLAKLAKKRPDLAIKKVNINRPGVNGIDWRSPLAQQYQVRQVPFFMIFNPQGQPVAQGREAIETVGGWLQEAGLMK
ncbi:MAG: thioredoxin family protein [Desulfobacterales bacterium]|nr:thioredoxin family protein [Pseudomonadota bacterium]MBU4354356.1 thioredoxin family protein [Pseudomonadota bacterium]MCG2772770.1 thioredoxin family protein [Desulfobacterales bacterium]